MYVVLNEGSPLVQTPREWQRCDLNPKSLSGGRGYAVAACPLCSMTAEGGWALLLVTFTQGRLQPQGLGVGRESGAHLLFSTSRRAPLTLTGQGGPFATLNLREQRG